MDRFYFLCNHTVVGIIKNYLGTYLNEILYYTRTRLTIFNLGGGEAIWLYDPFLFYFVFFLYNILILCSILMLNDIFLYSINSEGVG